MRRFGMTILISLLSSSAIFAQQPALVILSGGAGRVFTVPAGTSTMTIEAWGGGGGGSIHGGGQGGGYFKCTIPVQQNGQMQINVGTGGKGGINNGTNGGYTTLNYTANPAPNAPTYTFTAQGGVGSNNGAPLGGYSMSPNPDFGTPYTYEFSGYYGANGYPSVINAVASYDSNFVYSSIGGSGGDAANSIATKGIGGSESYRRIVPASINSPNTAPLSTITSASKGLIPGGGGGGAACINQTNAGTDGGDGQMIIHYYH